ncbi:hypothetical protein L3Q82_023095 [Scortum barcoo]|uniref:Uncharacterized protein n=1 Tax=Scortum barcoo TaxID=214431 RepID=A0ACB8WXD4_9TELE|nr:hypothetical protein L3Q82_023095 [Scortum barcoo]
MPDLTLMAFAVKFFFLFILRYKERLQTKYLKAPTSRISSVGSYCLDDFSISLSVLLGTQRGVSPVIFNHTQNHNSGQKARKCISKDHACFSKQMIQKQVRREYVAAVEEKLKQHPLVMYPHYKDHMTPELFYKVVSVLDPDMCLNSASAIPTPAGNHVEEENYTEPSKEEVDSTKHATSANKMQV